MGGPAVQMWDASYDWVTLTARGESEEEHAYVLYRAAARACVARALGGECSLKPWAFEGYRGETGATASYGTREGGHIFQATQYSAHDARGLGLPFDNVSRCDIAVTVWYDEDNYRAIEHHKVVSRRFAESKGANAWETLYLDGGKKGDTTYIGARTSDIYARIYDKWRESKGSEDYRYALRYEVEYKGEAAKQVWASEISTTPGREYLASVVSETLRRRGVFLPPLVPRNLAQAPIVRPPKSDTDRRLAWLRNQVAPSVAKLLTAGVNRATVLEALGLGVANKGE